MLKPCAGNPPVGRCRRCQFPNDIDFRPTVRQHVDEVEYHNIEVIPKQVLVVPGQGKTIVVVENFVVGMADVQPLAFDLLTQQFFLEEVFPAIVIVVFPVLGILFLDLSGMEAGKNGIPTILGRRRQNAIIRPFALNVVEFSE